MYYTVSRKYMDPALWEQCPPVPMMAVASCCYSWASGRLIPRRMPPHCRPLACDSGGYVFAAKRMDYPFTPAQYVAWLDALRPDWAACMDYPVGGTVAVPDEEVRDRQRRAITHAHTLLAYDRPWQWVPVLQGRTVEQYREHAAMYRDAGLVRPYMGVGSLVGIARVNVLASIVHALAEELPDTQFHLFGVKLATFRRGDGLPPTVASADTGAWNGSFFTQLRRWKEAQALGLTKREHERNQLYVYKAKVDTALAQPKQQVMF